METLLERLEILGNQGYVTNLKIQDESLYSYEGEHLPSENVNIDNTFRIESDSDPTHQTVVYAISCTEPQLKGILVNSFGPYTEPDKARFIEKVLEAD